MVLNKIPFETNSRRSREELDKREEEHVAKALCNDGTNKALVHHINRHVKQSKGCNPNLITNTSKSHRQG